MTENEEYLVGFYTDRAAEMTPQYNERFLKGTRVEIDGGFELPVRLIVNRPKKISKEILPVYINLHGGAFAEGDAVLMDAFSQKTADMAEALVINLNYRLFPEVRYPYPVEELNVVYHELTNHAEDWAIDPKKIAVGGFSAGGTIAFGSEIHLLTKGEEGYCCIVGGYPMTSGRREDVDATSAFKAADGELEAAMRLSMCGYEMDPICSSILADDSILKKIPAAVIVTCGIDDLGEMGRRFVERLKENQVSVLHQNYEQAYHGFIEANQPDFFMPDPRRTPEQKQMSLEAEKFIISGLKQFL